MTEADDSGEAPVEAFKKKNARDIFAIDRRVWAYVCGLGLNPAVAYLVMARGSGPDQRTTSWSVHSVEKYTGISRPRAVKAVRQLKEAGLIQVLRGGGRPRYYLQPPHEIRGCEGAPPQIALKQDELAVYNRVCEAGRTWVPQSTNRHSRVEWANVVRPYDVALDLAEKGWLQELGNQWFAAEPYDAARAAKPDWIWLPITIVDGAAGEVAPVEIIRQSQSLAALRLFIDLYHSHHLPSEGGIPWRPSEGIHTEYQRNKVGERGEYVIWGFERGTQRAWATAFVRPHLVGKDWRIFWAAFNLLVGNGLVEMVPHLVESYTADGEIIHSLGVHCGDEAERAVATQAELAAHAMLEEWQLKRLEMENEWILVPVPRHLAEVQLVGIGRLRYRPQTEATGLWFQKLKAQSLEWARLYECRREGRPFAPGMQHQG